MRWHEIPGWLTDGQAALLANHARQVSEDEWVVEIGSHKGRSTAVLAANAGRVLAVDPWANDKWGGDDTTMDQFLANLSACHVSVTPFHGTSAEAAEQFDAVVGMLFIDGAHDRQSVLTDIDAWRPHLAPNAVVCLHDAFSSVGVTRAVLSRYVGSPEYRYIGCSRSLIALRREPLRLAPRVVSTVRLLSRLSWFARNLAVKAAMCYVLAPRRVRRGKPVPILPY